jgi:GT2 family glycosyltransferase
MNSAGFSIIVPVFAPPAQLRECLEALCQLDTPRGGFEVVVVDDGSPTPHDDVLACYSSRIDVRLLRQCNRGAGAARNAGARIARGKYLVFTDVDCRPAREWLTVLAERFEQTPDFMLGGHTVNRLIANRYAATSQLIVDVVYAFYNARPEAARFFASNNLAMPAALFRAVGGFDEDVFRVASEDRELCDRWRHTGRRMAYVPEAVVFHAHALTLAAFCRQHFSYGRGAWNYHRRRAERGSGRMRDDFRFYPRFFKLVRGPLAQLPHFRRFSILALLALWQAANATGFAYEACRAVIDPAIRAF